MTKILFLEGRLGTRLSPPNFEIFLIFPNFLRSVVSRLATRKATRIKVYYARNQAPYNL